MPVYSNLTGGSTEEKNSIFNALTNPANTTCILIELTLNTTSVLTVIKMLEKYLN